MKRTKKKTYGKLDLLWDISFETFISRTAEMSRIFTQIIFKNQNLSTLGDQASGFRELKSIMKNFYLI